MWLWCLFIIMRMKISSIWLLPRKLRSVKCRMCPRAATSFSAQIDRNYRRSPATIFRKWNYEFLNARNSLLLSLFHLVSSIVTQKEQEITFHYLLLLQKWLDHLIPSFHCFYFLQRRTSPPGGGSATIMVFEKYYRPGRELEVATTVMPALYCGWGTAKNLHYCIQGCRVCLVNRDLRDVCTEIKMGQKTTILTSLWVHDHSLHLLVLVWYTEVGSEVKDGSKNRLREDMIIWND